MTAKQELTQALERMKYHTNKDDLSIYKTPGGWWHVVVDNTFEFVLSAPTARTLTLCIDAYVKGYNKAG